MIFIVDDDDATRDSLRLLVECEGFETRDFASGRPFLDAVQPADGDCLILDVNMPGMDGYEVLAAIRREGIPTRVLLLTARQKEGDILQGFYMGADDYLIKPFNPMELTARLKRLLPR